MTLPTKTISASVIFLILGKYFHYFGYTYTKGYLSGIGFNNPHIELTIMESISQSGGAIQFLLYKLITSLDASKFWQESFILGGILSVIFFIFTFVTHIVYLKSRSSANQLANTKTSLLTWVKNPNKYLSKSIFTSIAGFFGGIFIMLISVFFLFLALSILWMFLVLGESIGVKSGKERLTFDICTTAPWKDKETNRLRCNEVNLSTPYNGIKKLIGGRIYTNEKTIYFLTNCGSYELSNNLIVRNFTKNQRKGREECVEGAPNVP